MRRRAAASSWQRAAAFATLDEAQYKASKHSLLVYTGFRVKLRYYRRAAIYRISLDL